MRKIKDVDYTKLKTPNQPLYKLNGAHKQSRTKVSNQCHYPLLKGNEVGQKNHNEIFIALGISQEVRLAHNICISSVN